MSSPIVNAFTTLTDRKNIVRLCEVFGAIPNLEIPPLAVVYSGTPRQCMASCCNSMVIMMNVLLLFIGSVHAEAPVFIHPTRPGSNVRNYSQPSIVIQADKIYPTRPGSKLRDFSKSGMRVEGDMIYPTRPGTNLRDFSKPGMKIDGNMIYPTHSGSDTRDYSNAGVRIEGNTLHPTRAGANVRHYGKSSIKIEGGIVYPTRPGTSIRDYSRSGKLIEGNLKEIERIKRVIGTLGVWEHDAYSEKGASLPPAKTFTYPTSECNNGVDIEKEDTKKPMEDRSGQPPQVIQIDRNENIIYIPILHHARWIAFAE